MIKDQLSTPILFLIYNRPIHTEKVFSVIRQVKPKKLYIAADGPNLKKEDDFIKCEKTREIVDLVDWSCELKTLFRKENLGCSRAIKSSIDWFFKNVDEGIILEDDCYPSLPFFTFCERMLHKYRSEESVMHISGNNFDNENLPSESHYFSSIPHVWGWATWSSAWHKYDDSIISLKSYVETGSWKKISDDIDICNYWLECYFKAFSGIIDTWDYIWCFSIHKNNGISINPAFNLVENIGFDKEATHTVSGTSPGLERVINFENDPLIEPRKIEINTLLDCLVYCKIYRVKFDHLNFIMKAKKRLKRRILAKKIKKKLLLMNDRELV